MDFKLRRFIKVREDVCGKVNKNPGVSWVQDQCIISQYCLLSLEDRLRYCVFHATLIATIGCINIGVWRTF